MVLREVVDEFICQDGTLYIKDPGSELPVIELTGCQPGIYQARTHKEDKGFGGVVVTMLEVIHITQVSRYSLLTFSDEKEVQCLSGYLGVYKGPINTPSMSKNTAVCGSFGTTVFSDNLVGVQKYSICKPARDIVGVKLTLTNYG